MFRWLRFLNPFRHKRIEDAVRMHLYWMGCKVIESQVPEGSDDPDTAQCIFLAQEMLDRAKPLEDALGGDPNKL